MPHADFLQLPPGTNTKQAFWTHVSNTLEALLTDGDAALANWASILANASAFLYGSFESFEPWGTDEASRVNWCGFYVVPELLGTQSQSLVLGPFQGRPACGAVALGKKQLGVCATAFVKRETVLVPNVDEFPGHIACDGLTKSEIVLPVARQDTGALIGVLDIDCQGLGAFEAGVDDKGLEAVVRVIERCIRW